MLTKIIAHCGSSACYPENTLLAFHQAVRAGVEGIELDVHASADGHLIVYHAYLVATPGRGYVFETPSEELRRLFVGDAGQAQAIPFLREVFEVFGNTVEYELELKGFTLEFLTAVIRLVQESGLMPQVEFTSPHPALLWHLRQWDPAVRLGRFVAPWPAWMPEALGQMLLLADLTLSQINVAHCPVSLLSSTLVRRIQTTGRQVAAANCNTSAELEQALALGVDRLSTDQVGLALALRGALLPEGLGA